MNHTESSTHFQYCSIEGFILFGHDSWRFCANGCWRNVQYWNPPPSECKTIHSNLKTGSLNKLFELQIINTTIVYLVSLYTFRWKLWKCSIKYRTLLCSQFYQCIFRSQICNFCVFQRFSSMLLCNLYVHAQIQWLSQSSQLIIGYLKFSVLYFIIRSWN